MKLIRIKTLILLLPLIFFACKEEGTTTVIDNSDEYKLVWSDEFDTDGTPNPKNWRYEYGFVRNQELQYYKSTNAVCNSGLLIIRGDRDSFPNPDYRPGSLKWQQQRKYAKYSSASLYTEALHSWKFGRFEMRS